MKSLFEEMGGTYRQEGDDLIPNLALPDDVHSDSYGAYARTCRSDILVRPAAQGSG